MDLLIRVDGGAPSSLIVKKRRRSILFWQISKRYYVCKYDLRLYVGSSGDLRLSVFSSGIKIPGSIAPLMVGNYLLKYSMVCPNPVVTGTVGRGHGTRATTRAEKNRSGGVDGFLSGVVFRLEDIAVSNSRRCKLIIKSNGVAKSILAKSLLKED